MKFLTQFQLPHPPTSSIPCFVRLVIGHYFSALSVGSVTAPNREAVKGDWKAGQGRNLLLPACLLQVSCWFVVPVTIVPALLLHLGKSSAFL